MKIKRYKPDYSVVQIKDDNELLHIKIRRSMTEDAGGEFIYVDDLPNWVKLLLRIDYEN